LRADRLSAGRRPLVCLAGASGSFAGGTDDILRRFGGLRLSAATARRVTAAAGQRLQQRQRGGDVARAAHARPWDFCPEGRPGPPSMAGLQGKAP
jgi:hypothetical protein